MGSNPFIDAMSSVQGTDQWSDPSFANQFGQSISSQMHGADVSSYNRSVPLPPALMGDLINSGSWGSGSGSSGMPPAALLQSTGSQSNGGGGFLDSIWNHTLGPVLHDLHGALASGEAPPTIDWSQHQSANPFTQIASMPIISGLLHPQQAIDRANAKNQQISQSIENANLPDWAYHALNMGNPFVSKKFVESLNPGGENKALAQTWKVGSAVATDPLTYTPVSALKLLKAVPGVTKGIDALKSGAQALGNTKYVSPFKDSLGNMFVKYYGANPEVKQALQERDSLSNFYKSNISDVMQQMAQKHALSPDELANFPHAWEGTQPATNENVSKAIQELRDALQNGASPFRGDIGTNAELATKLNDVPILQNPRDASTYFPHYYGADPAEVKAILEGSPTKSFSVTGPFNNTRQFNTLQDAMDAGLKPELNPYMAVGQRLMQSADALTNANMINKLLASGTIAKEEVPGMVRSNILNSLKWLDNAKAGKTAQTAQQELENMIGSSPIHVNTETSNPLTKALNPEKFDLGKDLAGAKPRYKTLPIDFANPFDKAAYIVGNAGTRSARDADYLKALMDHTGLSEPAVRSLGATVRSTLKDYAQGAGDRINLPQILKTYAEKETPATEQTAAHMADTGLKDEGNFSSLLNSLGGESASNIGRARYFVNPNDETAFKQALQPYEPKGAFTNLFDKAMGAWKTGTLYNPFIHGHNIGYNGVYLGGAKLPGVAEHFQSIRQNPLEDDMFQRALKSGAISGDKGSFLDGLKSKLQDTKQYDSISNPFVRSALNTGKAFIKGGKQLSHGLLWDSDKAIRTQLFRQQVENGATDAEAAKYVNKYMVDYNNTTPFENKYMTRVFPFYRWMKGNIPLQVEQWANNTRRQAIPELMKDITSQAMSGNNSKDGKINTGIKFPGGGTLMVDPYLPSDEPLKWLREGTLPFLFGKSNPIMKETANQLANQKYYPFPAFAPSGKESMSGPNDQIRINGAPDGYNTGSTINHLMNNFLPVNGGLGQLMHLPQAVDALTGMPPAKNQTSLPQTLLESALKAAGTYPSTDNPAMDEYYREKDAQKQLQGFVQYLYKIGQQPPKSLIKAEYQKIPFPVQ